jgi:Uma2 family endonuclease
LISEILSPATALKDKNTKFDIYESFGVKYYLIVDPIKKSFELFKLDIKGQYELCDPNYNDFDFGEDCKVSVNLTIMFN